MRYQDQQDGQHGPHCHFQVNLEGEEEAIDPLHLFTADQVNSPTSYADNANPPNGPVSGDGLYVGSNSNDKSSSKKTTTVQKLTVTGSGTSEAKQAKATITISPNRNLQNFDEGKFQGAVKLRRLTPKHTIGSYDFGESEEKANEKYEEVQKLPGMGEATELTERTKQLLQRGSLNEAVSINFDDLAYLTIPYIGFDGRDKVGHMIVNKNLAEDVLDIFYELYDIKYPIENMEIAENFLENTEVSDSTLDDNSGTKKTDSRDELGKKSADNNNTISLYYNKYETSAHLTGNAIDLNPMINPKTVDSGRRTETFNAQQFVDRSKKEDLTEMEQRAFIDEESEAYKIFQEHGWTWSGSEGDYGHFEKTSVDTESDTEETSIESTYCDLSYVDEQRFNSYVATGDKRALYVYTLNSTGDVITASWSYDSIKGLTISKTSPIGFRKALAKYEMPIEYTLLTLVNSKDNNFVNDLADLGANSEYVVTIKDNVQISEETRTIAQKKIFLKNEGGVEEEVTIPEQTVTVTKETSSQTPEVTYVDNWYMKYTSRFKGASTDELTEYDVDLGNGADLGVNGTVTKKEKEVSDSTTLESKFEEEESNQQNQEKNKEENKEKKEKTVLDIIKQQLNTKTVEYKYSTGKKEASENAQRFVEIYKKAGQKTKNNIYEMWFTSELEEYEATANLSEVTQYLLARAEDNYTIMPEISFIRDYSPDDFGFITASTPDGTNQSGTLSLTTPTLSKEKFIEALNAYANSANDAFRTNFLPYAALIYDTSVAAGVNPELVIVTAKTEQNFTEGGGSFNYWGIGVTNGSSSGAGFSSLEDGIRGYANTLKEYCEGGSFAGQITQRCEERKAAGCDPTGYGMPGTFSGMQSVYSFLGNHEYGSAGAGGYYYMDPDRAGVTKIYKTHQEFVEKCQNAGGEHAPGTVTTVYEQGQYTAWQVEKKLEEWNNIFGSYGSLK